MLSRSKCLPTFILPAALAAVLAAPPALSGGPPFLSIEAPVDPIDESAHGAALLLHAHRCGQPTDMKITAAAEGLVDGRRQTIPLELRTTQQRGTYAVGSDWPDKGTWVLVFSATNHVPTTTIVELAGNGGIEKSEYYGKTVELLRVKSVRVLDRTPTERDLAGFFRPQM